MRTAAVWTSKSSSIRIPRSRHQPSSLRCASRRRRRHQMGAQRCDLPPETHRRRPHYRRRRYRKPHQEVLRDLARCLHSHHQHQRRRRHRRHLRRRFHRRAPRRGQVSARSGIASAGVRSTSQPSSVPTRPARPQPMRRSASPGLTLFSQRAGLPPTTAWQERKTQPAPKAPATDRRTR